MTLASMSDAIPLAAIVGGCVIAGMSIVVGGITGACKTRAREQTRREIAAYVAEGSISPEEGERLIKAGRGSASCGDNRKG